MLKSMSIHQKDSNKIFKSNFITSYLTFRVSIPTKSISIHQNDSKRMVKFNFVTSCLTFTGLILVVHTL